MENSKNINGRLSCINSDWMTPTWVIEKARTIMGSIDLDPASCEEANQRVKAKNYFNPSNSGLDNKWYGNVFLNPPGGKTGSVSNSQIWWNKAMFEYQSGRINNLFYVAFSIEQLCINPTMLDHTIFLPRKRLKFLKLGEKKSRPSHSNALILATKNDEVIEKFDKELNEFGNNFFTLSLNYIYDLKNINGKYPKGIR